MSDRTPKHGGAPDEKRKARLAEEQQVKKAKGAVDAKNRVMQAKAVANYIAGMSQRKALQEAGYAPATVHAYASKFFQRPEIRALVDEKLEEVIEEAELSREWIVKRLMMIADANVGAIMEIDDGGQLVPNYGKLRPKDLYAIQNLEVKEDKVGRGANKAKQVQVKIRNADKLAALNALARIEGLDKQVVEIHGASENIRQLVEGRNRIIALQEEEDKKE